MLCKKHFCFLLALSMLFPQCKKTSHPPFAQTASVTSFSPSEIKRIEEDKPTAISLEGVKRILYVTGGKNLGLAEDSADSIGEITAIGLGVSILTSAIAYKVTRGKPFPPKEKVQIEPTQSKALPQEPEVKSPRDLENITGKNDDIATSRRIDTSEKSLSPTPSAPMRIKIGDQDILGQKFAGKIEDIVLEAEENQVLAVVKKDKVTPDFFNSDGFAVHNNQIFVKVEGDFDDHFVVEIRKPEAANADELLKKLREAAPGTQVYIPKLNFSRDINYRKKVALMNKISQMPEFMTAFDAATKGSSKQLTINQDDGTTSLAKISYVSSGSYGKICKIEMDGFAIALKRETLIEGHQDNSGPHKEIRSLVVSAGHPYVLGSYGSILANTSSQRYALTSLELLAQDLNAVKGSWQANPRTAYKGLREAAQGLTYLHAKGFLHLDLKPGNLGIGQDGHARVIDLGATRSYADVQGGASDWLGTYNAASDLNKAQRTLTEADFYKIDSFSFGMTILEMRLGASYGEFMTCCQGKREDTSPFRQEMFAFSYDGTKLLSQYAKQIRELPPLEQEIIRGALENDITRRMSMTEIAEKFRTLETTAPQFSDQ